MSIKWSSAWQFVDKYYAPNTKQYKDNWDAIFGNKDEPVKDAMDQGISGVDGGADQSIDSDPAD